MKKYDAKVIDLTTGFFRTLTGEWDNQMEMEKELRKDGLILIEAWEK